MRVLVLPRHPRALRALALVAPLVAMPIAWAAFRLDESAPSYAAPIAIAALFAAAAVNTVFLSRTRSRMLVDDAAGLVHVRSPSPFFRKRRARTLERSRIRATGIRIEMNTDDDVVFVAVILLVTGESIDVGPGRMKSRRLAIDQAARVGAVLQVPVRS